MRTVRINKGELINTLTKNRKQHKEDFDKACEGYRSEMIVTLEEFRIKLKAGENVLIIVEDHPPHNHSSDYDVALQMLEMSVDQVIELTHEEFRHMVLDDWDWKRHWSVSNSKYLGK